MADTSIVSYWFFHIFDIEVIKGMLPDKGNSVCK